MNDLKFAFRQLLKNRGFTIVAVLSLSLGIGAGTAIFSLVNAILLRSLPVPNPHALRVLQWTGTETRMRSISGYFNVTGNRTIAECVSPSLFLSLREKGAELADIFAFAPLDDVIVRARNEAFAANGMVVSDNFFSALGVRPIIGRLFAPGNNDSDAAQQAVITFDWWAKHFGQDPGVLGQKVAINGSSLTIIGVLSRGFSGVRPGDPRGFYVLLAPESQFLERPVSSPEHWWVRLMARLRPAGGDKQLESALNVVFTREAETQMKEPKIQVQPGRGGLAFDRNNYGKPLLLMLAAVGLVMLVACANLAGLSLARGAARQHELAVRAALGACRWRLIRQSLTESLMLAMLGGALGVLLAIWGKAAMSRLLAGSADGLQYDFTLDLTVLSFTLAAALVTALVSGLLPALRAGRVDPLNGLKARGALGAPRLRAGRALVVAQIALSLLLLSGAGLYLRTLANLKNINAGFDTEKLLVFQVNPGFAGYKDAQLAGFYERVQDSVATIPGARGATLLVFPLLDNKSSSGGFNFPGRAVSPSEDLQTYRLVVGETFFATLGIPVLQGRALSAADTDSTLKVIVINETFAQKYFPGENPLGQTINTWKADWRIVGVCRDAKYQHIKEAVPPTAYIPFRQFPLRYGAYFAVRTALPPLSLATAVRKVVATIDPAVPVAHLTTQEQLLDGTISQEWLFATLCGALAGFALLLSCIGLYGLMAFNVTSRTSEIAIRMAVGAQPGEVARSILREALVLAATGIGAGMPAMFAVTSLINSQLYGVRPNDPATLTMVTVALVTVALFSAWVPARRAARVNPIEALRTE
jgi:predicted permease